MICQLTMYVLCNLSRDKLTRMLLHLKKKRKKKKKYNNSVTGLLFKACVVRYARKTSDLLPAS